MSHLRHAVSITYLLLSALLPLGAAHAQTPANYGSGIREAATMISCEVLKFEHTPSSLLSADSALRGVVKAVALSQTVSTPPAPASGGDWHVLSLAAEVRSRMKSPPDRILAPAYSRITAAIRNLRANRVGADVVEEAWFFPPLPARTVQEPRSISVTFGVCPSVAPSASSLVRVTSSNQIVLPNSNLTVKGNTLTIRTAPYAHIGTTGTTITVTVINPLGVSSRKAFALSVVHAPPPAPPGLPCYPTCEGLPPGLF